MKEEVEDKRYDKVFGGARLFFLLMHLVVILSNFNDQGRNISLNFPELGMGSAEAKQVITQFRAASTMALMFTIMQLIVLYVGTNRFRLKPTIYTLVLHFVGLWLYMGSDRWIFENIWIVVGSFSFLPTISQIAVALYTAKK